MTNATIDTTVAGTDGQVVTVRYKEKDKAGEQKGDRHGEDGDRTLPAGRAWRPQAGRGGVPEQCQAVCRTAALKAPTVSYGRDGVVPPM